MKNLPFVSIIIPTYQHWDVLPLCIEALKKQSYNEGLFEVIIVNNDSDNLVVPNAIDLADNMRVIHEAKPGSYAARNAALSVAKGTVIGFTDSDCIPGERWIESAVDYYLANEGVERIAGKVNLFRPQGGNKLVWYYETITAFNQKYNAEKKGASVTANMFVPKEVLDKVGPFNSQLYSGGDMEWNIRATKIGCKIDYVDNVEVSHPSRLTYTEIVTKTRRVIGGVYLSRKTRSHKLPLFFIILLPPVRFVKQLHQDGKSFWDILYALVFLMTLKFVSLLEVLRIMLGGKPIR